MISRSTLIRKASALFVQIICAVGRRRYIRFINSVAVLVLGFLLIVPTVSLAAEPPTGFRDLKWGSSPSASLKKFSGPTSDGITMYVPASGKTPSPFFGTPVAEEAYSFSKGKFYSGSAWFDGHANFEKVKTALVKAYGQPSFANEKMNLWKWKWSGSQIEVHLSYQEKFSRTTITFFNNAI